MNKKNIIILLVVAILLAGVTFWVSTLSPDSTEESAQETAKSYPVYDASDKEIKEIKVTLPESSYTLKKEDSGMYMFLESPTAALNQALIGQFENFLKTVTAEDKATDDAFNLSDFGFDNPKSTVEVLFDTESVTYKVGNLTQGSGYFFNVEGSKEVFVMHSSKATAFMKPVSYFRNPSLHSADTNTLNLIEFDSPDGYIRLEKSYSATGEEEWNMTSPIQKRADVSAVTSYITQYIALIQAKEYVEDNAANLSKYGLSSNARKLYFVDDSGSFGSIYIGSTHSSGVYNYARMDGSNNVVSIESSNIAFIDMNMFTFVDSLINLEVLADVNRIEFRKEDTLHILSIKRGNDSRKESENDSEYYVNDRRVSVNTFKNIYTDIIGLDIEKLAETVSKGNPLYEITYFKNDGSKVKIEFVKHTERHYAAFINGECKYIVLKEKLDNIYNSLNGIK